jgi:hypothetical protein
MLCYVMLFYFILFYYKYYIALDSWESTESRRMFFENIARDLGCNHPDKIFWYSLPLTEVLSAKVATFLFFSFLFLFLLFFFFFFFFFFSYFFFYIYFFFCLFFFSEYNLLFCNLLQHATAVLYHYNHSVSKALLELFPELGFDKDRLEAQCTLHLPSPTFLPSLLPSASPPPTSFSPLPLFLSSLPLFLSSLPLFLSSLPLSSPNCIFVSQQCFSRFCQ